jgi:hypothetical protein
MDLGGGGGGNPMFCRWVKQKGPTNGFDFDESNDEQIFDLLLREKQFKLPEGHKFPIVQAGSLHPEKGVTSSEERVVLQANKSRWDDIGRNKYGVRSPSRILCTRPQGVVSGST